MSTLVNRSRGSMDEPLRVHESQEYRHHRRATLSTTPSKLANTPPVTFPIPLGISPDHSAAVAPSHHPFILSPHSHSPLPLVSIAPAHPQSLRANFARRRSSYPPGNAPVSVNAFPFGTPQTVSSEVYPTDQLIGFGNEFSANSSMTAWTPGVAWEGLLNFDDEPRPSVSKLDSMSSFTPISRTKSENGSKLQLPFNLGTATPNRIAQFTSDLAWRTILGSVIEVEGVGEVGVGRVLHEVWKRGGGDVVSAQCLWPSIVMSLSLSPHADRNVRMPQPSASSSLALQQLYNMTLRLWEAPIFCGLLANYTGASGSNSVNHVYGTATPTKELDMSMWTNMTPGAGELSTLLGDGLMTPRETQSNPLKSAHDAHDEPQRRSSITREDDGVKGIDELLAAMEEGREEAERSLAAKENIKRPKSEKWDSTTSTSSSANFHFPTPETDVESPVTKSCVQAHPDPPSAYHFSPPESLSSPHVSSSSGEASIVSKAIPASRSARARHPTSLAMPTVPFIPPPPMCMFFNPAFHDLQKGKVGIWKGDIEVRGRGGGKFSILIVGEEGSGHLWQSHLWPSQISYPAEEPPESSSSMGMVLSNDPDVTKYVNMVQGLHAEGVAFHLPNPTRLPIVFLPSKFESSDPLQRLGIAFMSKPGFPIPSRPSAPPVSSPEVDDGPKKKRRRQSAPARPVGGTSGRKRESYVPALNKGGDKIEEEVIAEDSA
ncbi:hypothetical protein BCR39DRAFT_557390 [Naematelia encephala]|uniref:Uncharacterized protein n=1 Tax=Naematelia encephala TaxID=71784 RepID=A0A1Y2BEC3_9TREE|nr:hypothetical protein BCR39DRAFT_557390 [Naematelia encephala]